VSAPDHDLAEAHAALRSMEEQLVALYDEKAQAPDLAAMVESLEAQVCALIEEKAELQRLLDARTDAERPPALVLAGAA
jgi:hypothetical protein